MSIKSSKRRKRQIIEDSRDIDCAFCKWIIPRLSLLQKNSHGVPLKFFGNSEQWKEMLGEMKEGFQVYAQKGAWTTCDSDLEKVNKSLELFKEYFLCLWN